MNADVLSARGDCQLPDHEGTGRAASMCDIQYQIAQNFQRDRRHVA